MKRSNKWWAHVTRKQRPAWRGWRRKARDSTSTHTNSYGTELQHHPTANRKNCTGRWVLKSRRKLREGASSSRGRKVPPHVLLNQPPGSKSAEWGNRETWRSLTAVGMKTACEERGAAAAPAGAAREGDVVTDAASCPPPPPTRYRHEEIPKTQWEKFDSGGKKQVCGGN